MLLDWMNLRKNWINNAKSMRYSLLSKMDKHIWPFNARDIPLWWNRNPFVCWPGFVLLFLHGKSPLYKKLPCEEYIFMFFQSTNLRTFEPEPWYMTQLINNQRPTVSPVVRLVLEGECSSLCSATENNAWNGRQNQTPTWSKRLGRACCLS